MGILDEVTTSDLEIPDPLPITEDTTLLLAVLYLWNTPSGQASAQYIMDNSIVIVWGDGLSTVGLCALGTITFCGIIYISMQHMDDTIAYIASVIGHESYHAQLPYGIQNTQLEEYEAYLQEYLIFQDLVSGGYWSGTSLPLIANADLWWPPEGATARQALKAFFSQSFFGGGNPLYNPYLGLPAVPLGSENMVLRVP